MKISLKIIYIFSLSVMLHYGVGQALAQAKASTAANVAAPKESEPDNKLYWTHGSLMFDKTTANYLREALRSHEKKISLEILLPALFGSTEKAIISEEKKPTQPSVASDLNKINDSSLKSFTTAPSFYLKSILYFSPDNWSLWLNAKKITNKTDTSQNDVSVMDISRSHVLFLWRKSNINRIMPKWKDSFIALGDGKYASVKKDIVVDEVTGNISFMLKLNQSLISSRMQVIEGFEGDTSVAGAAPVSLDNQGQKADANKIAAATLPGNAAEQNLANTDKSGNVVESADIIRDFVKLKSILNTNFDNLRNENGNRQE